MIGLLTSLARPFMGLLAPESAHRLAIKGLQLAPLPPAAAEDARLAVRAFGLNFPNPVGMAPGFDKHAEVPDALLKVGYCYSALGQADKARAVLEQVVNLYPKSEPAALAAKRLESP